MLWEVGGYVSGRLKQSVWGDGVVRMLADYIHTRSPKAKGWSYRTLYKMVQFYDTYSTTSFNSLVEHYGMQHYLADASQNEASEIVPIELAQLPKNDFVPNGLAQIPSVLLATGWSNHQLIMSKCKTDEQRLFYMLYAGHEQLEYDELKRAFATDAMSSVLGSKDVQSEILRNQYPQAGVLFKDTIYLEMFGLPVRYKESKLRKEIVAHM